MRRSSGINGINIITNNNDVGSSKRHGSSKRQQHHHQQSCRRAVQHLVSAAAQPSKCIDNITNHVRTGIRFRFQECVTQKTNEQKQYRLERINIMKFRGAVCHCLSHSASVTFSSIYIRHLVLFFVLSFSNTPPRNLLLQTSRKAALASSGADQPPFALNYPHSHHVTHHRIQQWRIAKTLMKLQ